MRDSTVIRVTAMVVLGAVLIATIAGITVVAVLTDRNLRAVELAAFITVLVVAALGGLSIAATRIELRGRTESRDRSPEQTEEP